MTHVFQNFKKLPTCIVFLALLIFFDGEAQIHAKSFACDTCGSSTSGGAGAFGTLNNLSFVGLKYTTQEYNSRNGIFENSPLSKEQFNSVQLWGKIPLSKNVFTTISIPFQNLERSSPSIPREKLEGLGDITLTSWFSIPINKKLLGTDIPFANKIPTGHTINLGVGIKLPTGTFEQRLANRVNPGFQLGTGSTDILLSTMHIYSKKKFGVNTTASYYLKTANKNEYKFGNQLSFASNVFYKISFEKSSLQPFIGVGADFFEPIEQFNEQLLRTNGRFVSGILGTEYNFNAYMLGLNFTVPIEQELFDGDVTAKNRFSIYLNVLF